MVTIRHLELAEELLDIEPSATYLARGAALVAQIAGAASHRLEVDGSAVARGGSGTERNAVVVPVHHGTSDLGTLHLWFADNNQAQEEGTRLAQWAGRLFARGIARSRTVGSGEGPRSPDVRTLLARLRLTPRERDVVERLVSGSPTSEIARASGLTVSTVNTYLKRIFAKLGVHSRVELFARVNGTHSRSAAHA